MFNQIKIPCLNCQALTIDTKASSENDTSNRILQHIFEAQRSKGNSPLPSLPGLSENWYISLVPLPISGGTVCPEQIV